LQVLVAAVLLSHAFAITNGAMHHSFYADEFSEGIANYGECFAWAYSLLTFGGAEAQVHSGKALELVVLTVRSAFVAAVTFRLVFAGLVSMQHKAAFRVHSASAATYLRERGVCAETQLTVLRHLEATAHSWRLQDHFSRVVETYLPAELRRSVHEEMWVPRLMTLGLVRQIASWSDLFVPQLAQLVREDLHASHAVIFKHGDEAAAAYHIVDGEVVVMSMGFDDDPTPPFTRGMWLGEKALIGSGLRRATMALTRANCTLMSVPAAGFAALLETHDLAERFQEFCASQLWRGMCGRCGQLGDHFGHECPLIPDKREHSRWSLRSVYSAVTSLRDNKSFHARTRPPLPTNRSARDLRLFLKRQDMSWLEPELLRVDISTLEQLQATDPAMLQESLSQSGHTMSQEQQESISPQAISVFLTTVASEFKSRVREAQHNDGYILFLSHYKVEAGTEAALMRTELEQVLGEAASTHESAVFLDSEDLTTLSELQDAVRKSKNVALLLTANVLTRPWVLVELATAHTEGIPVLPVALAKEGNAFTFPDEDFFQALLDGSILGDVGTKVVLECGFDMETVVQALKQLLKRIALPYSPHRPASIRRAELCTLIQQCTLQESKARRVTRLKDSASLVRSKRLRRSDTWVANLLTKG